MKLHVGHELLLLHLDDVSGRVALDGTTLGVTFSGAVLSEWMFSGRLVSVAANQFVLRDGPSAWESLRIAVACMPGKPKPLKALITSVHGFLPDRRYRPALEELESEGLVTRETGRFLGLLPWRTRWPEANGAIEKALSAGPRNHLVSVGSGPPERDDALISLLRASKLLGTVWSERELASHREAIDFRTDRAPIGRVVAAVIQEMMAAAAVAT